MRILVTGSAGYIGNVLIPELLTQGHQVDGIDNLMYKQKQTNFGSNFGFSQTDVRDIDTIKPHLHKYDTIIMLAALVGMPVCKRLGQDAVETNRDAISHLLRYCSPNQRIIYPNSNSAYGTGGNTALTEESPLHPLSLYAQTKLEAEAEVLKHPQSTVFRLATVMGVSGRMRLDLLVNNLTYLAYFDKRVSVFEGNFRRNYVHVLDVAKIMAKCIDKPEMFGQVYNLGCDEANCTKKQLVLQIAKYLDFNMILGRTRQDPDKRDYIISNAKLAGVGLKAQLGLDYAINELISYYSKLPRNRKERTILTRPFYNA